MNEIVAAALFAFGVVFVAELGDKTQLLAMSFGARHSLRQVALGLLAGYGAAGVIAVVIGGTLGAALPRRPIEVVGGLVFIGFAVITMRTEQDELHELSTTTVAIRSSVVASIGLTILIGEMGDKTQIATATLASQASPLGTWIGATLGEVTSGMIGALAGTFVGDRISPRRIQLASAVLFASFGALMLAGLP